jgi:CxxC motif-containing protein
VKVHELVDLVSDDGEIAGRNAALFALGQPFPEEEAKKKKHIEEKKGVKNLSTEGISDDESVIICTVCPIGCKITAKPLEDGEFDISGNNCNRGKVYAIKEMTAPERTLTSIMACNDGTMVPVKTDRPVPKDKIFQCMKEIDAQTLMLPIHLGDIIIEKIGGTDANVVCTGTHNKK